MKYIISLFLTLIGLTGCFAPPEFPVVPEIEFKDFEAFKDTDLLGNVKENIAIILSFKDGDGDFGLTSVDTLPPYQPIISSTGETNYFHFNIHLAVKRVKDGIEEPVINILTGQPYIIRGRVDFPLYEGQATEGEIRYREAFTISEAPEKNSINYSDTLLFEATIVDRALNVSNTVTTPRIVVGDY